MRARSANPPTYSLRIGSIRQPQSRLRLSDSGIEIVIRYPVRLRNAAQTSDEIARRLVDAINREPALRLVPQSTPAIQPERDHDAQDPSREASPNEAAQAASALEPGSVVDNRGAAMAAAAAAGATVAGAFAQASEAEEAREGVAPPAPQSAKP